MAEIVSHNVLCNGATLPAEAASETKPLVLDYRPGTAQNVRIELPDFVRSVFHIPDRMLDLLEIAAFVYCADRSVGRGPKDAVEYHRWSRSFRLFVRVRDSAFWSDPRVCHLLTETLNFLSGDRQFEFVFQPGHCTPPADLFDRKEFILQPKTSPTICLFSGGLDSLSGVAELLTRTSDKLILVSHRSGQPGTGHTQDQLVKALSAAYPGRLQHYRYHCGLTGARAAEETQRTRMFLYTAIAASVCAVLSQKKLVIFENGITSLNFRRRQDLMNARATRTTHPKSIHQYQQLYSAVVGYPLEVGTPFFWKTKAEVLQSLASTHGHLIPSSVSCSRTFKNLGPASHCGGCSQCIDRRMATYAAALADTDEPTVYSFDFINQAITDGEVRTTVLDYIRQARDFAEWNADHFCEELLDELADVVDFVGATDEEDANRKVWELCNRHGTQVMEALARMRNKHDKLTTKPPAGSLLKLIAEREYLKTPVSRLVENICARMQTAIPIAFQKHGPKDEPDFNDKVSAILSADRGDFEREHPAIRFGLATTIPDHSWHEQHLLIESKFIRNSTTPSKASDGIAADLIKYPRDVHVLFLVYDPHRAISDDEKFCSEFEKKRPCTVVVIR